MGTNLISVPLMVKMTDGGIEAAGSKNLISRDLCHRDRHLGRSWDVASFPASKVSVPLSHARSQIRVCLQVLPFCPRSFREDIPGLFSSAHRKTVWKSIRTPLTLAEGWLLWAWCPAASGVSWSDSHVPAAV